LALTGDFLGLKPSAVIGLDGQFPQPQAALPSSLGRHELVIVAYHRFFAWCHLGLSRCHIQCLRQCVAKNIVPPSGTYLRHCATIGRFFYACAIEHFHPACAVGH
jgi:hypothetical protein